MIFFSNKKVIITEKMDGENTTLYNDYYHARSLDSRDHPSRSWVKAFHASISWKIPDGWRVCGENVFAKHSIHYSKLKTYFYGISIWDHNNICLEWYETLDWFNLLGIIPVPIFYSGLYNKEVIKKITNLIDPKKQEGYVIRNQDAFKYDDFSSNVAKFVRKKHVQTNGHWMYSEMIKNELSE